MIHRDSNILTPNILLVGNIGSGKDEVARILTEELGFYKLKLGKYIREHVDLLAYDEEMNKRGLYQDYGQWARKTYGDDVWNNITYKESQQIKEAAYDEMAFNHTTHYNVNFVVADGRQWNEVEFWRKKKYRVVGIYAPYQTRFLRVKDRDGFDQHAFSNHETELSATDIIQSGKCDFVITNEGIDLNMLKAEVIKMAFKLSERV